ncbi:MAG TPA: hydrolase TatD [Candidatus Magasanikbacteria bacterium]|uniref:YabD n=1 Tax=Candidatus Magasanikbacteria bacterium GW2011_GWE2_42_7 TaxID=1619052 RepID=A0A0G1BEN5_9BACT|nr:MAG: YabD [Candidatus Magasanikbacteria bacterium GW2011_GWC2_42_27]KKS71845.1 MAG: YabD [Candidatus Magasanikbacteria bacterium GW2011_GWE2_42_7]KKT26029.1 MAG: YabD [Candidatus Magasanikbacteria bacterium GW2011_GWA2_43_9]HBB37688.1 hydrolase TatD [Candidatus Magasanikbacteria bacterium]HCM53827.1 hydrolase TatD [Candidatus Magasanikbacteria bacterium]
MLIDTHCHIQFKAFYDDVEDVISRCHEKDMILNLVGTQAETSKKAVEWAEKYDWMYASVGLHPIQEYKTYVEEEADTFITRGEQFDYEYYKKLALHPKTIGIGETGLDRFHIPKNIDAEIVMNKQKETFLQHVRLAQEVNKPLIVHIREAHDDMEEVIRNLKFEIRNSNPVGVIHCFTGNWQQAQTYLNAGFFIGFTGVITYPPKKSDPKPQEWLNEVVEKVPLDRIVVETDSPYLAPHIVRGQRNEPWRVEEVVKCIAEVRGLSISELEAILIKNSKRLFSGIV